MTIAYIVAIGSYSAFAISQLSDKALTEQPELWTGMALGLPLMCLIFASLIIQHHVVIAQLGDYIEHELVKAADPVEWQKSKAIAASRVLKSRVAAQLAISVFPTGLSVHITHRMSNASRDYGGIPLAYTVETVIFLLIIALHAYALAFRFGPPKSAAEDKTKGATSAGIVWLRGILSAPFGRRSPGGPANRATPTKPASVQPGPQKPPRPQH
jgi:hypothetical protein